MSHQITSIYVLPPNVKGRCHFFLDLTFEEFRWKIKSYPEIEAKIIWWGENHQTGAVLRFSATKSSTKTIRYNIATNAELFHSYLVNCEPIEVKLTSVKTQLQIGTIFIQLPTKIVNFNTQKRPFSFKSLHQIFSPRNYNLGEILIQFNLIIAEEEIKNMKFDKLSTFNHFQKGIKLDSPKVWSPTKLDLKNGNKPFKTVLPTCHFEESESLYDSLSLNKKTISTSRSFHDLKESNRSSVLDFLKGKPMTKREEIKALEEICSISPAHSLIEALNETEVQSNINQLTHEGRSGIISVTNLLDMVDSVRITIESLSLTAAGIREIHVKSRNDKLQISGMNFLIEGIIGTALLTKNGNHRQNSADSIRIFSKKISDNLSLKIRFDSEAVRFITIPNMTDLSKRQENNKFVFSIWWRDIGLTKSQLLGNVIVKLSEIINCHNFSSYKRCPVKSISGDIFMGSLIVKIELGRKGIHFGKDFIDAVSFNKENSTISNYSYNIDIDSQVDSVRSLKENQFFSAALNRNDKQSVYFKVPTGVPELKQKGIKSYNHDNQEKSSSESRTTSESDTSACDNGRNTNQTDTKSITDNTKNKDEKMEEGNDKDLNIERPPVEDGDGNDFLHGLLYVGAIQNNRPVQDGGYFLVCRSFWKEDDTSTDMCQNDIFNFLETFPIICNAKFLDRTRNNHLNLELWLKTVNAPEQLIGVARLPLHQFYIAYRDSTVHQHLKQTKLPVIAVDGWSVVASPLSAEFCGRLQTLLAIGTEEQIEFLKVSRGLTKESVHLSEKNYFTQQLPVPNFISNLPNPGVINNNNNAETQTSFIEDNSSNQMSSSTLLSAFIENLAQRLPVRKNVCSAATTMDDPSTNSPPGLQIRRTSDLLDALQRALTNPPTLPLNSVSSITPNSATSAKLPHSKVDIQLPISASASQSQPPQLQPDFSENDLRLFKVLIEIESALQLPRNAIKVNKKCNKRNKSKNRGVNEIEPSSYVTFEATGPATSMVKSHEGPVYTTNVVEKNCNPQWNKRFEVSLPVDLMINDEKRFIVKVWRKTSIDIPQCRLLPNPFDDAVIGFSAIDLTVLMAGLPCISGWYNIIDFFGRCNGQIKINIQPLENIAIYRDKSNLNQFDVAPPSSSLHNLMLPLSIDVSSDISNVSLSRALKRKFTELEEITQRLKSRLFDVTGDADIDPDDEFERDLNTTVEEEDNSCSDEHGMEVINSSKSHNQNFGWLGLDNQEATAFANNMTYINRANEFQNLMAENIANSSESALENATLMYTKNSDNIVNKNNERDDGAVKKTSVDKCADRILEMLTGKNDFLHNQPTTGATSTETISQEMPFSISDIFKKHDIDTFINPNIFKHLIDPKHVSSDETTPRLDTNNLLSNISNNVSSSTSSSVDQDKIKMIENALQQTAISDLNDDTDDHDSEKFFKNNGKNNKKKD